MPSTSSALLDDIDLHDVDLDTETHSAPRTRAEAREALAAERRDASRHSRSRSRHGRERFNIFDGSPEPYVPTKHLPRLPLLLMAAAGFVTMMTEALPVSVMPSMRDATGWSDGTIGQLVTAYGLGCGGAAIPMTLLTRDVDRRQLVLMTTAIFVITNVMTMLTAWLPLMLAARFVAGCCAGLLWAVLAGYATRLVLPSIAGRAMALAMLGTPLALALGIPLGSKLGEMIGWRGAFLSVSVAAAAVLVLGLFAFPGVPGEVGEGRRRNVMDVVALPGLMSVLVTTALYATAHNLVYTYLPALVEGRQELSLQGLLLAFGAGAVAGLMIVGRLVDRYMTELASGTMTALAVALFVATGFALMPPVPAWVVAIAWGMVFGGAPTIFQTGSARICGESQDIGQALVVTVWNGCVALAAVVGGAVVDHLNVIWLPVMGAALAAIGHRAATAGGFDSPERRRGRELARRAAGRSARHSAR